MTHSAPQQEEHEPQNEAFTAPPDDLSQHSGEETDGPAIQYSAEAASNQAPLDPMDDPFGPPQEEC